MYSLYFLNSEDKIATIILHFFILLLLLIFNFIMDLLDFKEFAKDYYYLDINIFRFTLNLLRHKMKIM